MLFFITFFCFFLFFDFSFPQKLKLARRTGGLLLKNIFIKFKTFACDFCKTCYIV